MISQDDLYISSEGGPIIVGDFSVLSNWDGIFGSGKDYDDACQSVNGENSVAQILRKNGSLIVWNFGGAGSAIILEKENKIFIIYYLADDFVSSELLFKMIEDNRNDCVEPIFDQDFPTGCLIASWATEEISQFEIPDDKRGAPNGDMSIGDAAGFVRIKPGKYSVKHWMAETENEISLNVLEFEF